MSKDMGASPDGDWLVIRYWQISVRQIAKASPKLFKLGAGTVRYPMQIGRSDPRIICVVPTLEIAERVRAGVAGVDGEYQRRHRAARAEFDQRTTAAREARDKVLGKE